MSNFVYGGSLTYQDYLTARSFSNDIALAMRKAGHSVNMSICKQTREIIASNEALFRENIRVVESLESALSDGFSCLSYDLQDISAGISELNSTFHWGFGQMLVGIGRMNDTLTELIKIAKTPAQTAAYEQFEIARDAFRRQLYKECLEALDKAISGDHTAPGYKLEWRFHQMKGVIHLGFVDGDISLVDLGKAEETFLLAARYAQVDFPEHAAVAFLSAGWAAYCQGRLKEALAHTEKAIGIKPHFGEALLQSSKVLFAMGEVDVALSQLGLAIDIDRFYTIKAAGDGDFQKHDARLRGFLNNLRKEKLRKLMPIVNDTISRIRSFIEYAPKIEFEPTLQQMESFVLNGEKWPLVDVLEFSNIFNASEFVQIQLPEKTITSIENYEVEEIFQEEVITKPGNFFRKTVTEKVNRTRMVTKTRKVKKKIEGKIIWLWVKKMLINNTDRKIIAGQFYHGTVTSICDFGAFVSIFPGIEGLIHISDLDIKYVKKVSDIVNIGDKFVVKCLKTDYPAKGNFSFSRKEALNEYLYGGLVAKNRKIKEKHR